MGKQLCISVDCGETQYNYEFNYTIDGDTWHCCLFEELEDARACYEGVCEQNQENKRFLYYARRLVQVETADFIDKNMCAVDMRIVDRHSEGGRRK